MDRRVDKGIQRVEMNFPGLYHHQIIHSPHHWTPHNCHGYELDPIIYLLLCHLFTVEVLVGVSNWCKQAICLHPDTQRDRRGIIIFLFWFPVWEGGACLPSLLPQWGTPHNQDVDSDAAKPKNSDCALQSFWN